MISFERAEALLRDLTAVCVEERVTLDAACGRIATRDLLAEQSLPRAPRSAMDGFALHHGSWRLDAAGQASLAYGGSLHAGERPEQSLRPGQALAVTTGAFLPPQADTVVPHEWAERGDAAVRLRRLPAPGENVVSPGEELAAGTALLRAGERITPRHLLALAACGYAEIPVRSALRVAFLQTGDELVDPGLPLAQGQIYNTSRFALGAELQARGAQVCDLGVSQDDQTAICTRLEAALALGVQVVLTTGGVSVGERDLIPSVCEALGAERLFWRVGMKPGKAVYAGRLGTTWIFGLSGNPHAALASFYSLVAPGLARLAGEITSATERECRARLAATAPIAVSRLRLLWARNDDSDACIEVLRERSVLETLLLAQALVLLPPRQTPYVGGEHVRVIPLDRRSESLPRADALASALC